MAGIIKTAASLFGRLIGRTTRSPIVKEIIPRVVKPTSVPKIINPWQLHLQQGNRVLQNPLAPGTVKNFLSETADDIFF